jgi:hypothetical protein
LQNPSKNRRRNGFTPESGPEINGFAQTGRLLYWNERGQVGPAPGG